MANDYYSDPADIGFKTKSSSSFINNELAGVAGGFELLPPTAAFDRGTIHVADVTGSADAYIAAVTSFTGGAYIDYLTIVVRINITNTGASTVNVNSLGAKTIKRPSGTDVDAGDLTAGALIQLSYDLPNNQFIIIGALPNLGAQAAGSAQAAAASAVAADISDQNAAAEVVLAALEVGYAQQWASAAEDVLITSAAGGDEVDDYSARHWAIKAEATAVGGKQAEDATLTAISGTPVVAEKLAWMDSGTTFATVDFKANSRSLVGAVDYDDMRDQLGVNQTIDTVVPTVTTGTQPGHIWLIY